jgi:hypothetical protein
MENHEYVVGLSFTTEGRKYAIHIALRSIDSIVVKAGSVEEAEAQADQIRSALEEYANSAATSRALCAEELLFQ